MDDEITLDFLEAQQRILEQKMMAEIQKREAWEVKFHSQLDGIKSEFQNQMLGLNQKADQVSTILDAIQLQLNVLQAPSQKNTLHPQPTSQAPVFTHISTQKNSALEIPKTKPIYIPVQTLNPPNLQPTHDEIQQNLIETTKISLETKDPNSTYLKLLPSENLELPDLKPANPALPYIDATNRGIQHELPSQVLIVVQKESEWEWRPPRLLDQIPRLVSLSWLWLVIDRGRREGNRGYLEKELVVSGSLEVVWSRQHPNGESLPPWTTTKRRWPPVTEIGMISFRLSSDLGREESLISGPTSFVIDGGREILDPDWESRGCVTSNLPRWRWKWFVIDRGKGVRQVVDGRGSPELDLMQWRRGREKMGHNIRAEEGRKMSCSSVGVFFACDESGKKWIETSEDIRTVNQWHRFSMGCGEFRSFSMVGRWLQIFCFAWSENLRRWKGIRLGCMWESDCDCRWEMLGRFWKRKKEEDG